MHQKLKTMKNYNNLLKIYQKKKLHKILYRNLNKKLLILVVTQIHLNKLLSKSMHMILKRSNKNKHKLSNKIKKIKINKVMKVLQLMIHKL